MNNYNYYNDIEDIFANEIIEEKSDNMANLSKEDIDKIGNTIIYLSNHVRELNKTKILKLFYLIELNSIMRYKTPFLGLPFYVWVQGPVQKDIYNELNKDEKNSLFKDYFTLIKTENRSIDVNPIKDFNDDEFSDNDIKVIDYVIDNYGEMKASELSEKTHKRGTAWNDIVSKKKLSFSDSKTSKEKIDFCFYLDDKCDQDFYKEVLNFLSH